MTIKEICEKYGISQTGLARRFDIPLRTVQGWYLGERKPPSYVPGMIEKLLEVEMQAGRENSAVSSGNIGTEETDCTPEIKD